MGNSLTAGIATKLLLDHDARAGENLSGKVIVYLCKERYLPTFQVKIYGKEKVSGKAKIVADFDPNYNGKIRHAERLLFQADIRIQPQPNPQGGPHTPGEYVFPFQITLPASLPQSTTGGLSHSNGYRIQYKTQIIIQKNKHTRAIPMSKAVLFVVQSARLPHERVPITTQPKSFSLKAAGLARRGDLHVVASIEDTHIGKGERLNLRLACRNLSKTVVNKVRVELIEEHCWYLGMDPSGTRSNEVTRVLLSIKDVALPALERDRVSNGADMHIPQEYIWRDLLQALQQEENCVGIRIPTCLSDSYVGSLVSIRHRIRIKFETPVFVTKPELNIPIRVGQPPMRDVRTTVSPSNNRISHVDAVTSAPQDSVPMVSVSLIPDNTIHAPMTTADDTVIVLGGDAILVDYDENFRDSVSPDALDLGGLVPVPPPAQAVSLNALLTEMTRSLDDYDIISRFLRIDAWCDLLSALSPPDFGSLVAHVSVESDRPRVAVLLAQHRPGFTCAHLVASLQNCSETTRTTMVQKLVDYCTDLSTQVSRLRACLNEWECIVTKKDIERALQRQKHSI